MGTKSLRTRVGESLVPLARAWIRYAPIPIGKAWLWRHFHWRLHLFKSRLAFGHLIAGSTEDLIQRHLYYFGVWEPDISAWIRRTLRCGDGFIDIGANIGYYSLLASKLVGTQGVVVAVEPSPPIHSALTRHIRLNRRANIRAIQAAATEIRGNVKLFPGRPENIGKTTTLARDGDSIEVPGLPMSEVLDENEIRRARIIKIDVEGAELHVLRGLTPLLSWMRKDLEIVMEISSDAMKGSTKSGEEIFSIMRSHGFTARRLDNDYRVESYIRSNSRRLPRPMTASEIGSQSDVLFSRVN
jgi:FkbM family methyltransferase